MNELSLKFHEIQIALGAIALFLFIYGPWQWFIIDLVRQRLFEIRDRLFDSAKNGQIAFDDERYTLTRDFINSALRFAEHTSFMRILFVSHIVKEYEQPKNFLKMQEICKNKDNPSILKESYDSVTTWITISMWLRSPAFIFLTVVFSIFLPLFVLFAMISDKVDSFDFNRTKNKLGREIQREVMADFKFSS